MQFCNARLIMNKNLAALAKPLIVSVMSLFLMNCSTAPDVKARDNQTLYTNIKLTKEFPNTRLGVTLEHQSNQGEGDQFYPQYSLNTFSLGSTSFTGKWNALNASRVGINVYLGVISIDSQIDSASATNSTTHIAHKTTSIISTFAPYFIITNKLRLRGEFSGTADKSTSSSSQIAKLGIDYQLSKISQLSVGFQTWEYIFYGEHNCSSGCNSELRQSEVELTSAGVFVGLALSF